MKGRSVGSPAGDSATSSPRLRDAARAQTLARLALATADSGFALVDEREVLASNARFDALDHLAGPRGRWQVASGPAQTLQGGAWRKLTQAVIEHATRLRRSADRRWSIRLVLRPLGASVDVVIERRDVLADAVLVTATDVSERLSVQSLLERARTSILEREQTGAIADLTAAFAHDLTTMLAAARLRLDALKDADKAERALHELALEQIIELAGTRLLLLQDVSWVRKNPAPIALRLADEVNQALELVRTQLRRGPFARGNARQTLHARISPDASVKADPTQLKQLLVSVILASMEGMSARGTLKLHSRRVDGGVRLLITDTGPRFNNQDIPTVFDPFFLGVAGRSNKGLPLTAAMMLRWGGTASVRNRPRRGVELALDFPALRPRASAASRTSLRLLLIGDDEVLADSLVAALQGALKIQKSSRDDAIRLLKRQTATDAVLFDLALTDTDGWALLARIRSLRPKLPLYVLSSSAKELGVEDPRRKLVAGVIQKPVSRAALLAILKSR